MEKYRKRYLETKKEKIKNDFIRNQITHDEYFI